MQHFRKSNRLSVPAPKAPALPTGLYPDTRYKVLPDVVKHVVRRILPQIPGTFKRGKWGYLRRFRAGSDIFGAVAETVSWHPKLALYQAELRPDDLIYFTRSDWGCQGIFCQAGYSGAAPCLAMSTEEEEEGEAEAEEEGEAEEEI